MEIKEEFSFSLMTSGFSTEESEIDDNINRRFLEIDYISINNES